MILFWFIAALMVLLALWFILPALLQSPADAKSDGARAANLLVYQDQLRELEADLKAALLSQAQYEQDKEELERRLLEDVGDSQHARSAARKSVSRKLAYAVAIAIPVVAITFYLLIGKPETFPQPSASPPNMGTR